MSQMALSFSCKEVSEHLVDIHDGAFVDDEDLQQMLGLAWFCFVSDEEQEQMPQEKFVNTCFQDKEYYLIALNGEYHQSALRII